MADEKIDWNKYSYYVRRGDLDKAVDYFQSFELSDSDLGELIARAVNLRKIEMLSRLVAAGVPIDQPGLWGRTAMFDANDPTTAEYLVSAGLEVNATDDTGFTPLLAAAQDGDEPMVRYFLEKGANAIARNNRKQTSLHLAAKEARYKCVALLLQHGVEIDVEDYSARTPLMDAVDGRGKQRERIAKLLIDHGADVNRVSSSHTTPLMMAASSGSMNIIQLLLDLGADASYQNAHGDSAITEAVMEDRDDVVSFLRGKIE